MGTCEFCGEEAVDYERDGVCLACGFDAQNPVSIGKVGIE